MPRGETWLETLALRRQNPGYFNDVAAPVKSKGVTDEPRATKPREYIGGNLEALPTKPYDSPA